MLAFFHRPWDWTDAEPAPSPATQMGNAVSPVVAVALGRCLAKAAAARSPAGEPVIEVVDPVLTAVSHISF